MGETKAIPKYSLVPKFWKEPMEIECVDIVSTQNKITGLSYVKFIDTQGRLGVIKEEEVGIHFLNFPTQVDLDDFSRLKKEAEEFGKTIESKKLVDMDVSIR